ncbi:MAG: hypothetical protein ACREDD_07860 [Methylocella sp.]
MKVLSIAARIIATAAFLLGASFAALAQSGPGVVTHHNDFRRTGWNAAETILTPAALSLASNNFGVIATVNNLDDTPEAQPLVVPNVQITCPPSQTIVTCQTGLSGVYDVVYVATVANTVYAINADNGQILLQRNFGTQIACGGIKSTPVIDPVSGTMYVMIHTFESGTSQPYFTLHALKVGTLMDSVTAASITDINTTHTLTDGTVYGIDGKLNCQRSALLLVGGNIYAGFRGNEFLTGSPPHLASGPTRGWLLGWTASTLAPLPPLLTDAEATAANSMFLSSIWMSGSGIASDGTNLYFSTGNSDYSGTSYNSVNNIEESVVKVTPNLTIASIFTPSNFAALDAADLDLGAGGVLVIPHSPLVVDVGKDGRMFLLNSASLGGYTPGGPDHVLDMQNIGGCWCAPSYFMGPDGIGRVVSSGGNSVMTWEIVQSGSPSTPHLVQEGVGQISASNEDPGFFTSVSSNGVAANHSGIIWAVGRPGPAAGSTAVTLYAFDATAVSGTLPLLGQYPAGTWTLSTNANIVPVVAKGKVYVASSAGAGAGTLTIFGLNP